MLVNVLFCVLFVAVVLAMFVSVRVSLRMYLVAVLIAPYGHFFGQSIRIEHLLTPVLLGLLLVRRGGLSHRLYWLPAGIYSVWFVWIAAVTIFRSDESSFQFSSMVAVYGFLRPALVMALFGAFWLRPEDMIRSLIDFVGAAVPLATLSVAQALNWTWARFLTEAAYISTTRDVYITSLAMEKDGFMVRGISVFENPSYAGLYYVLALATCLMLLTGKRRTISSRQKVAVVLGGGAAAVGGAMTLSATFLCGSALVLAVFLLKANARAKLRAAVGIAAIALAVTVVIATMPEHYREYVHAVYAYQKTRIASGDLFAGRFLEDDGLSILPSWHALLNHPWFGLGVLPPEGVIVNDSLYLVVLCAGGFLGSVIFLAIFPLVLFRRYGSSLLRETLMLWTVVMFVIGFGCSSYFNPRMLDWSWAMIAAVCTSGLVERGSVTKRPQVVPADLVT